MGKISVTKNSVIRFILALLLAIAFVAPLSVHGVPSKQYEAIADVFFRVEELLILVVLCATII